MLLIYIASYSYQTHGINIKKKEGFYRNMSNIYKSFLKKDESIMLNLAWNWQS